MNKKIEELYNKIDGLNNIIDLQTLEIAKLKNKIGEAIEYIDKRMDETEDEELQWIEMGIVDYWKELNDLRKILGDKE